MAMGYNLNHCSEVFSCLLLSQIALLHNPVEQLASITNLQHQVYMSFVLEGSFQLCNVGMITHQMQHLNFLHRP